MQLSDGVAHQPHRRPLAQCQERDREGLAYLRPHLHALCVRPPHHHQELRLRDLQAATRGGGGDCNRTALVPSLTPHPLTCSSPSASSSVIAVVEASPPSCSTVESALPAHSRKKGLRGVRVAWRGALQRGLTQRGRWHRRHRRLFRILDGTLAGLDSPAGRQCSELCLELGFHFGWALSGRCKNEGQRSGSRMARRAVPWYD